MGEDKEFDLAESKKKIGELVPVLLDAHGKTIDGFHRKEIDPNWHSITLENIKDETQLTIARLAVNVCRRKVPAQEKTMLLTEIAKLTKWTPKEIAENLGMSYQWVMKYLADEYKERPGAGPKEYPVTRRVTQSPEVEEPIQTEPIPKPKPSKEPVECPNCHLNTWFPYYLKDGTTLCSLCFEKKWRNGEIKKDDLLPEGVAPPEPPKKEVPKPEVKTFKPEETWEHRKAQMQPQHSKIELAILEKLQVEGIHPVITDRTFCLQATTPDFYFPNKNLAVYLDGIVHQGKEDRDDKIRELLTKRHGVQVLSIPYTRMSGEEVEWIFKLIKEAF